MQITELLELIEWFNDNIIDQKLPTKYATFYNKLNLNVRQGQSAQPFQDEKDELFQTLELINFQALSLEQIKFLEKQQIADLLGEQGVKLIDNVLFESNIDIASASARIADFLELLNAAVTNIKELENALTDNFSIEETDEIPNETVLMRVYFQQDVAINNLADFKKLSAMWYDIGRGIAMAQDKSPEDFNIIGAKKGSIIIDMAVAVTLATTVSKILLEALKVADRFLEVQKKVQEVKALKLGNKKIESELKKEAEKEKTEGINTIVAETVKELKLNANQQGDKITGIEKSIKKLVQFTENGGIVDFVQPEENEDDSAGLRKEIEKLKTNISEIRLLENQVKLLENKLNGEKN